MKRLAIAALVIMASLSIAGCSTTAVTTPDGTEGTMMGVVNIWTDQETGVEYVIAQYGQGIDVCPRYNQDGSIKVVDK